MGKVVKVNVYITDMRNFDAMNEAYLGVFENPLPVSPHPCQTRGSTLAAVIGKIDRNRRGHAYKWWGFRSKRKSRWNARLCFDVKVVRRYRDLYRKVVIVRKRV